MSFPRACYWYEGGCGDFQRFEGLTGFSGGSVGADGREGFEEADDGGEVALGEGGESAAGLRFYVLVDSLEFEQAGGVDVDEKAAAVGGVGLAADVATLLEAVERDSDSAGG